MREGAEVRGEHYFTPDPRSPGGYGEFQSVLAGRVYRFVTGPGVFSRRDVDRGTRILIESVKLAENAKVLDLGCGYGVIGIVLSGQCPKGFVWMVDVNRRAVELARTNIERNKVTNALALVGGTLSLVPGLPSEFDTVVTNPPIRAGKEVVHRLLLEARDRITPGGSLFLVARTSQGVRSLRSFLTQAFGNANEVSKKGGFRVMNSIKEPAPPLPHR